MSKKFLISLILIFGLVIALGYWLTNSMNQSDIVTDSPLVASILEDILPSELDYRLVESDELNKYATKSELVILKSSSGNNLGNVQNNRVLNFDSSITSKSDGFSPNNLLTNPLKLSQGIQNIEKKIIELDLSSQEDVNQKTQSLVQSLEQTYETHNELANCTLNQVNTIFEGLDYLDDFSITSNYIQQLDQNNEPTFDIISSELNNLIQKEQKYLLYDNGKNITNIQSISLEAGVELIQFNVIDHSTSADSLIDLFRQNLNSLQTALEC